MAGNRKKWFSRRQDRRVVPLLRAIDAGEPPSGRILDSFVKEVDRLGLSRASRSLLVSRADLPPDTRLIVNLSSLLHQYAHSRHISSVVGDGLSDAEQAALVEIADKKQDAVTEIVAHAVLNVQERHVVAQLLNSIFSQLPRKQKEKK